MIEYPNHNITRRPPDRTGSPCRVPIPQAAIIVVMKRRRFLQMAATVPAVLAAEDRKIPEYRVVSRYKPAEHPGMPGLYPGKVVSVHAEKSIDVETEKPDPAVVREMMTRGMRALTGDVEVRDSWAHFIVPSDVVGIKVNCSGAPGIMSTPEVVAEIVRNVTAVGVKPEQIWLYERFQNQVDTVHYDRYLPKGVHIFTAEGRRGSAESYDPNTYVETLFFNEDDTRSNMIRLVSERLTKIINVPNMKDHGAAGVTGCLKNIAYGSFSNVARSHYEKVTNTYSFIGMLASVEPLRSRTVLQVMDGLRAVWHGGPFSPSRKFRFYPKQMMFGTDPVAIDHLMLDIIDKKRNAEGALSIWNRDPALVKPEANYMNNPQVSEFIREPGYIEYASRLGLGVYDPAKIKITRLEV
jgi:uncharacterized protein (DUF362 family)